MTNSVILEIEGMDNSFQKKYTSSSFAEEVPLSQPPQYGWKTIPVTFVIEHKEFGHVLLKTDISSFGDNASRVIYSRP